MCTDVYMCGFMSVIHVWVLFVRQSREEVGVFEIFRKCFLRKLFLFRRRRRMRAEVDTFHIFISLLFILNIKSFWILFALQILPTQTLSTKHFTRIKSFSHNLAISAPCSQGFLPFFSFSVLQKKLLSLKMEVQFQY